MPSQLVGQTILSQYKIEEFIAETTLGELYRAVDVRTNRSYAFTLLPKSISEKIEAIKELEAESSILRAIKHPNITPYLGVFQAPTLAFLLEEWIDGPSLKDVLQKALVNFQEALIYVKALCNALEALHKRNYLH